MEESNIFQDIDATPSNQLRWGYLRKAKIEKAKEIKQKKATAKAQKIDRIKKALEKRLKTKISLPKIYGNQTVIVKPEGRGRVGNTINSYISPNFYPKKVKK